MVDNQPYGYGSLTSWEEAEPSFSGTPHFLPKIRYTVTPGTFVSAVINNRSEIVRILSNPVAGANQALGGSRLKVNVYSKLDALLAEYSGKDIHLEPEGGTPKSVYTRSMLEIVQTTFLLGLSRR